MGSYSTGRMNEIYTRVGHTWKTWQLYYFNVRYNILILVEVMKIDQIRMYIWVSPSVQERAA